MGRSKIKKEIEPVCSRRFNFFFFNNVFSFAKIAYKAFWSFRVDPN